MTRLALFFVATFAVSLAGCDSGTAGPGGSQTEFDVRYVVTGTCVESQLGGDQLSIAYTVDGGQTTASFATIPFEQTVTINTQGPNTAVAMAADCPGAGTTSNTITAELYVDGDLEDTDSETGATTLLVSVAVVLNPQF